MSTNKADVHRDLQDLLSDERVSDVTLQGTDGGTVLAVRAILAARSKVFKRMFFGAYKESTSLTVTLDYTSAIIRAIIHYCYGDELKMSSDTNVEEHVRDLVRLLGAAHFFDIPGLEEKAFERVCALMTETPSLACTVFDEVDESADTLTSTLGEIAQHVIRLRTESAFMPTIKDIGGISSLKGSKLRHLVQDGSLTIDSLCLFQAIVKWRDKLCDENMKMEENVETSFVASELVQSIDLSTISPSDLANVVEATGLVKTNALMEAFKVHALCGEKACWISHESSIRHRKTKSLPIGNNNGVAVYSKLDPWGGHEPRFTIDQHSS